MVEAMGLPSTYKAHGFGSAMRLFASLFLVLGAVVVFAQSPHGERMKLDCAACHDPQGWTTMRTDMTFDHGITNFPLEGSHTSINCKQCHTSIDFDKAPSSDCISCHTDVHNQSVGNDCIRCHTPQNWLVNTIPEIHEQNGFPLVGSHIALSCVDCHSAGNPLVFARLGNDCINCHMTDFQAAKAPDHVAAGYSMDCTECHDPFGTGWSTNSVNHDFFPLVMGHAISDCAQCHTTPNFSDASPECVSCHQQDFNNTVSPSHTASGFSTDCASCHSIAGWVPATFDHNNTAFPLHGTHITTACIECHANGFAGTPTTCNACHMDDYNSTTAPNHAASGFPTDCAQCHDETNWGTASFDHNNTAFPLHGTHITTACIECHANGYAGTPTACNACHMDDYNSTTAPNHAASGFPTDCAQCHDETNWGTATFDHNNTAFPLHGAHTTTACIECHANGYAGTPTACSACHLDDYNSTNNPNHASAQFPMDCTQCHNETAWQPSTFDHDNQYFPIYSGRHDGEWNTCADCHNNPNDYSQFTCINCHEHNNQNDVNDHHNGVNGYSYNSAACFSCHPDGN